MFEPFAPSSTSSEAEKPEMRSVSMMMRTPALQFPPSGLGSISKPSPLGLSKPLSLGRTRSDSLKVKQTWTGVTAPCAWDVKGGDLDLVPVDFPLERTHRTIKGVDATEVAKRISDALRSHSIETKFVTKPVKAKCKTNDLVSFRIRLYAGGENGLPVVVEVQRRSGSVSSFMKSCRAILAAAEGKLDGEEATMKCTPPFMKPMGEMKCVKVAPLPSISAAVLAEDSIKRAASMVRSEQKDTNALGLEDMLSLTDPIKTSPCVAVLVSKCVVLGDENFDIREDLRAFTDRDVFGDDGEEEGVLMHAERVRHLALAVFANALNVCSRDGCLEKALEEQTWFKDQFMSSLVDELKLCETNACCAIQASRCIGSLLQSSGSARVFLKSCGVVQALEDAYSYGKAFNDMLADESERCLKFIDL